MALTYEDALADVRKTVEYWRKEHDFWLAKDPSERQPATLTRMALRLMVVEGLYEQMKARYEKAQPKGKTRG